MLLNVNIYLNKTLSKLYNARVCVYKLLYLNMVMNIIN